MRKPLEAFWRKGSPLAEVAQALAHVVSSARSRRYVSLKVPAHGIGAVLLLQPDNATVRIVTEDGAGWVLEKVAHDGATVYFAERRAK